jgi:hypothetical protein
MNAFLEGTDVPDDDFYDEGPTDNLGLTRGQHELLRELGAALAQIDGAADYE